MKEKWGDPFSMGGLGGIPVTEKKEWQIFLKECKKDGNIFILFAPHVAINSNGQPGKILRKGQDKCSLSCEASINAYKILSKDANINKNYNDE